LATKPSLIDHLSLRLGLAMLAALTLLAVLWSASEYVRFLNVSSQIKGQAAERQHAHLRQIVADAVAMIDFERQQTINRVEAMLKQRVEEAHALASHQIKTFGPDHTRQEVLHHVRESLRPIRFNGGRGYFFAFDLAGTEQLFAARPDLEGKNMLELRGARGEPVVRDMLDIVKAQGSGFTRYYWTQPGKPGDDHLKVSYVKLVEPLGWVVGTGEYVEDMEAEIQAEVIRRLSSISFGDNGYVFASRMDGLSLVGPHAGRNPLTEPGSPAAPLMQRFIQATRDGGGVVDYDMPGGYGAQSGAKTAYVMAYPQWGWFIGATTYADQNNALVLAQAQELKQGMLIKMAIGGFVALALGLAMWRLIRAVNQAAARDMEALNLKVAQSAETLADINPAGLAFIEHELFAATANTLIAKRRQAEQSLIEHGHELERINADLERFAYVTSHDLQEPLRTVQLFLQMLERHLGDTLDQDGRDYIGFAVQGAQRMRANILSLLAYSRAGSEIVTTEKVDLGETIASVVASLKGAIDASQAEVTAGPMPVLTCDGVQIGAVLLNLVSNALRYRHPERTPRIVINALSNGDAGWLFTVADNGTGIPAEYHQAVFEVFRRFNQPGQEGGSGIGLALCRRIVEAHGGRIWLQSDETGTTFFFTLPAAPPDATP
jgi:signal transduction histidine kinase